MLERLLTLLLEGGTHRVTDLAVRLEVTPELILNMLEGLENMGFLRQASPACIETCTACSMASYCTANAGEKAWMLTKKATSRSNTKQK